MVGALLMCGVATTAFAQSEIAVKAGINFSNLSQDSKFSPDDKLIGSKGLVAGIMFTRPMSEMVGLQIEGLFSQKGNVLRNEAANIEDKVTLNYLEIPVLARFDLSSSGTTKISVHAGPAFAFKIGSKETNNGEAVANPMKTKSMDIGLAIGGQVAMNKLIVGARYTLGLTNIFDDIPDDFGFTTLKNKVFTVFAGFRIK